MRSVGTGTNQDVSLAGNSLAKSHRAFATNELVLEHALRLPEEFLSNHCGIVNNRFFVSAGVLEEFESLIAKSLKESGDVPEQFSDEQITKLVQSCYSKRQKWVDLWPGNKQRGRFIKLGDVDLVNQSSIPFLYDRHELGKRPRTEKGCTRKKTADDLFDTLSIVGASWREKAILIPEGLFFHQGDFEDLGDTCRNSLAIRRRKLNFSFQELALDGEYYLDDGDNLLIGRVVPVSKGEEIYKDIKRVESDLVPAYECLDLRDPLLQHDQFSISFLMGVEGELVKLFNYTPNQRVISEFFEGEEIFKVEAGEKTFLVTGHAFGRFMQRSPMSPRLKLGEEKPKLTIAPFVRAMAEMLAESVEANTPRVARRIDRFKEMRSGAFKSAEIRVANGIGFVVYDEQVVKTCLKEGKHSKFLATSS